MLKQLNIRNFALIKELEIFPDKQLNTITGETGAGKSIMLGALGLLMGNRADVKTLYDETEKCVVEGQFDIGLYHLQALFEANELDYEVDCIIRREIAPSGKSRAFINDSPVTLDVLKEFSQKLIDIHSQHDAILLGKNDYQLGILDTYAVNDQLLLSYTAAFRNWQKLSKELQRVEADATFLQKEFELNNFLFEELEKAALKTGEQETAEEELQLLEHAEEVKSRLQNATAFFNHPELSLGNVIKDLLIQINGIAPYSDVYKNLKERILSVQIELNDIGEEIENLDQKLEFDEDRISQLKERLDLLFRLQNKHGVKSVAELQAIKAELAEKVSKVLDRDGEIERLKKALSTANTEMQQAAEKLSIARKKVQGPLEEKVTQLLIELGMPNAIFKVSITKQAPTTTGIDEVEFMFSANKGFEPQAMRKVASGGEFSRLMLALKYILAEKKALPTIIFDEIDTGISGEVAIKMSNLMKQMADKMQVVAITHLHQIASKGHAHYFVFKNDSGGKTISQIKKLLDNERILEIAKMIGGDNPSDSAIQSAVELIGI